MCQDALASTPFVEKNAKKSRKVRSTDTVYLTIRGRSYGALVGGVDDLSTNGNSANAL